MKEKPPESNGNEDHLLAEKEKNAERILQLGPELHESGEVFPFPGMSTEVYEVTKADDEAYPGFRTPIDVLLERFKKEGMKILLGKFPESGNVFVLPGDSDDLVNDGIELRAINIDNTVDERVKELREKLLFRYLHS